MPAKTNLQLNSCQAKDKPPRPLRRINRHDLYGASAAGRLTAQRRAGLPVRKVRFGSVTHNIQFDVTLFKAHEPLIISPLSDETLEGE